MEKCFLEKYTLEISIYNLNLKAVDHNFQKNTDMKFVKKIYTTGVFGTKILHKKCIYIVTMPNLRRISVNDVPAHHHLKSNKREITLPEAQRTQGIASKT